MDTVISYSTGGLVKNDLVTAGLQASVPTTLSTSESQLFCHVGATSLKDSQFTVYLGVTLGGVASATFYYYWTPNFAPSGVVANTVWYPVCLYNSSTNQIPQRSVIMDSTAYSTGGISYATDELPVGSSVGFLITGKSASGTPAFSVNVMRRNN